MANRSALIFTLSLLICLISSLQVFGDSIHTVKFSRNLKKHSVQTDETLSATQINGEENDASEEKFTTVQTTEVRHPCQRTCEEGKVMTCHYEFNIEYYSTLSKACFNCPYNITQCNLKHCIPGDGVKRTVLVVNRQMPGPSIEVCHGDTIEVQVNNQMMDISTTIHWHGLFQKATPFMDGVPFVSQCLIGPQGSFLYRFFADNPGTHFWHAHSALQRGDGIYGPLIVKVPPKEDPHSNLYDFDLPEHVITILDWEHTLSANKFVAHYHSTGDNKPPSILINGKGRYQEFRDGENIIFTPAEKFTVKQGHRYRFRVINAGFLNCPIEMSIDNHNITVIATDGGNLEPVEAESLVSVAGERFDIILHADQEVSNYWIRFKGLLDCKVKNAFQVAILNYEGTDDGEDPDGDEEEEEDPEGEATYDSPITTGLKINPVNTGAGGENELLISELRSLPTNEEDPRLKREPDIRFYIPYDFYPVDNIHYQYPPYEGFYKTLRKQRTYTPQINHISMQFPPFPLLADPERSNILEFCNASSVSMECRFKFCECPHILEVPLNAVVEIILIDEGVPFEANHPFHLHGFTFRVLGMDRLGSSTSEEEVRRLDEEGLLNRNFENPPIKDTVTVPDGGYVILRFFADNPGYWILHCHLDFHVELGMALLFKVGDSSIYKPPPENFPVCGNSFIPKPVNQTNKYSARFFPKSEKLQEGEIEKSMDLLHTSSGNSKMYLSSTLIVYFITLKVLYYSVWS